MILINDKEENKEEFIKVLREQVTGVLNEKGGYGLDESKEAASLCIETLFGMIKKVITIEEDSMLDVLTGLSDVCIKQDINLTIERS